MSLEAIYDLFPQLAYPHEFTEEVETVYREHVVRHGGNYLGPTNLLGWQGRSSTIALLFKTLGMTEQANLIDVLGDAIMSERDDSRRREAERQLNSWVRRFA